MTLQLGALWTALGLAEHHSATAGPNTISFAAKIGARSLPALSLKSCLVFLPSLLSCIPYLIQPLHTEISTSSSISTRTTIPTTTSSTVTAYKVAYEPYFHKPPKKKKMALNFKIKYSIYDHNY